jgi:hypothetical protein
MDTIKLKTTLNGGIVILNNGAGTIGNVY